MELDRHRQQFPALAHKAYFNYGGQGPLPTSARAAIQHAYDFLDQTGPFSNQGNTWFTCELELTRAAIATELRVSASTIALTEDVTMGCNIVLWGMSWERGDHILLTDCEHPGVIATVKELQRRYGLEVSTCPMQSTLNAGDPVACIVDALQPHTRLVVLSHILWNTGQVLPLTEIISACHRQTSLGQPVRVLVDAAQSVGVLPLDLQAIQADFYAFTGHKWWCGPAGIGGLYVNPDLLHHCLRPTFIGWRGITIDAEGQPTGWQPGSIRFEVATSAAPLYGALRAAIALHNEWGTDHDRYRRILDLSGSLWEQLTQIESVTCLRTAPPEAGLVSFQLKDNVTPQAHRQLVDYLEAKGMMIRVLIDPTCVRACVHYLTLPEEIEQLIQGIAEFCL